MSNQYTSQSISGYNATPPSDDGANTANNEITWAKHKTKLTDPVKTLAESMDSAITTAFALNFLNDVVAKSSAYTIQTSDRGKAFSVTNATTITLLPVGTADTGFAIAIFNANSSGQVTIDGDGTEEINGATTLVLDPGEGCLLSNESTAWTAFITGARVGSTVTNYGKSSNEHIHDDGVSSTVFDADAVIGATYESVGPTGSGATNIWTAMDDIPSDAVAVKVRIRNSIDGTGLLSSSLYHRPTGDSASTDFKNVISTAVSDSAGLETSTSEMTLGLGTSDSIDLALVTSGSLTATVVELYLIGWIE